MNLADALIIAATPARHEMPTLWAALRVLAPIAERAVDVRDCEGDILPGDVGLMQRARRLAAIEILGEG